MVDRKQGLQQLAPRISGNRKHFLLSGNPETGKIVLAGHVVKYLEQCNADCRNHFFKQNNSKANSIATMLRSLAFQMASSNPKVRASLPQIYEDGEQVDKDGGTL